MATITGLTAERMLEIEAASIVDGDVVGGNLILTQHDGTTINAGSVIGPSGPEGPPGADFEVLLEQHILDVGIVGQIRAGRQLSAIDFTQMGLSAPLGLWNLGNISDSSGNTRNLTNKGSVAFDIGINGGSSSAARFNGATTQALYIADTGGADPFRIRTGSWGCWFRTPKKGVTQTLMSKGSASAWGFFLQIDSSTGELIPRVGDGSTDVVDGTVIQGTTDVCDDYWHFVVFTYDGAHQVLYVDGVVQHEGNMTALGGVSAGPLNIGAAYADSSTAATSPHYGFIDEAFVTADILTAEQVQNLHCAKIPHLLGVEPKRFALNVQRLRRGIPLLSGYFPSTPLRLYNFTGGVLTDGGSGGVSLTNNGVAVSVPGADGTPGGAYNFDGTQSLSSSDTGLPDGVSTRSYGCWFKANAAVSMDIMGYGDVAVADVRAHIDASGELNFANGSDNVDTLINVVDGKWHFLVVVENNSALNGVKRRCYLDGRMVGSSTTMNSVGLGGANRFRVGGNANGSSLFRGVIDTAFVSNVALTPGNILDLYARGTQNPGHSPRNPADHIEAFSDLDIYANFMTLDSTHKISLAISS